MDEKGSSQTLQIECYQKAIQRDQFLAIAFFQQGVSNFLMGDFEEALANFNDTLLMLRGNRFINYEQLGLTYKLYSCAVLFNRGLCYIYMLSKPVGMQDLKYAAAEKATEEHDVIDEAIAEDAEVRFLPGEGLRPLLVLIAIRGILSSRLEWALSIDRAAPKSRTSRPRIIWAELD